MLVILCSTNACNLACGHCSAPQKGERRDLTLADCEVLAEQLPSLLGEQETVTWLWHGGEPTLLNPQSFSQMQAALDRIRTRGFTTRCSMQSNGYALDADWLDVLLRHDVHIGLSLDGPADLHNAARVTADGRGTYDRVVANFKKLTCRGISVSLLCTLRREHVGHEDRLFAWLEELDAPMRLNPLLKLGRAPAGISMENYFAILRRICVLAMKKSAQISLQPLRSMFAACLGIREISECSFSGKCGQRIFSYGPGAVVGACNRSDIVYGSLKRNSLAQLWESAGWQRRRARVQELATGACGRCAVWTKCHGGCPEVESCVPDEADCAARRNFFAWLESEGLDLLRDALLRRRNVIREKLGLITEARADFESHFTPANSHV